MEFEREIDARLAANRTDEPLQAAAKSFLRESIRARYSYNFSWLGRPIIQYPQDIVAMQQLIWSVQPDLIVETGIAHGGSLVFSASMLELNAACGGPRDGAVIGIDIDIRRPNRDAIEAHPLSRRIRMVEGSSIDPVVSASVRQAAAGCRRVMVCLDSNHTHEHVLAELEAYAGLVSAGSYCVVFDTVIEDLPQGSFPDRPWDRGNNPGTAVAAWLKQHDEFAVDTSFDARLLVTVAPNGFLRRVK